MFYVTVYQSKVAIHDDCVLIHDCGLIESIIGLFYSICYVLMYSNLLVMPKMITSHTKYIFLYIFSICRHNITLFSMMIIKNC